jgi:hypothetical protein
MSNFKCKKYGHDWDKCKKYGHDWDKPNPDNDFNNSSLISIPGKVNFLKNKLSENPIYSLAFLESVSNNESKNIRKICKRCKKKIYYK